MKNIKRISLSLAIVLILYILFSLTVFADSELKPIEENNKIFTYIPSQYELSVFGSSLSYSDENGNLLDFCLGENKFAPNGITELSPEKVQVVFEHFYLYNGEIDRTDECFVNYKITKKAKVNGYSCYYLTGNYAYIETDLNGELAYYFNSYIFATEENIFIVTYEDIEGSIKNTSDLSSVVDVIVFNGTHLGSDKPEKNGGHDFSNSPSFEEAVLKVQQETISTIMEDESIVEIFIGIIVLIFIVPTAALIILAVVLIKNYLKNKKKLKRYEMVYGAIPTYNTFQQNFGGYNQPFNQPYQPPVNPVYQNTSQTPTYVTDAINNLEQTQSQQPVQATEIEESINVEGE